MFRYFFLCFFLIFFSVSPTYSWLGLHAENGDVISSNKWNEMITLINTKLNQDNVTGTGNIEVHNSGTGVVVSFTGSVMTYSIPDIITTEQKFISVSTTATVSLDGDDFIPNSVITIPGFPGTINSISIPSQSHIDINVTTSSASGTYDVVISNNGVLNTTWPSNGVNLIKVGTIIPISGDDTVGRKYINGEYATSCNDYKNSILPYSYTGDIGNGQYWIKPDGNPAFKVYCDMITDGGGWTRIEYASDLPHQAQFTGGDANRWLDNNFTFILSDTKINAIRSVSTEGKQTYHSTCQGVIHYLYQTSNYNYAFGFRFFQGQETVYNQPNYSSTNITVPTDGCTANNNTLNFTEFDIIDIRVPVINVHSRDNSSTEKFGSELTNYPAWLR